jgi:hypothetical protein
VALKLGKSGGNVIGLCAWAEQTFNLKGLCLVRALQCCDAGRAWR